MANHAALIKAEHALTGGPEHLGNGGKGKGTGLEETGGAGVCAAESGKLRCVPLIRVGDGISDHGGANNAQGGDGGGFVSAHARAYVIGNSDRSGNQNDGDDEQ